MKKSDANFVKWAVDFSTKKKREPLIKAATADEDGAAVICRLSDWLCTAIFEKTTVVELLTDAEVEKVTTKWHCLLFRVEVTTYSSLRGFKNRELAFPEGKGVEHRDKDCEIVACVTAFHTHSYTKIVAAGGLRGGPSEDYSGEPLVWFGALSRHMTTDRKYKTNHYGPIGFRMTANELLHLYAHVCYVKIDDLRFHVVGTRLYKDERSHVVAVSVHSLPGLERAHKTGAFWWKGEGEGRRWYFDFRSSAYDAPDYQHAELVLVMPNEQTLLKLHDAAAPRTTLPPPIALSHTFCVPETQKREIGLSVLNTRSTRDPWMVCQEDWTKSDAEIALTVANAVLSNKDIVKDKGEAVVTAVAAAVHIAATEAIELVHSAVGKAIRDTEARLRSAKKGEKDDASSS